ncbi:MAG: B3/4 domain-containing protein [Muribaculaceae bacterium]
MIPKIIISEQIHAAAPGLRVLAVEAAIDNVPTPDTLWGELTDMGEKLHRSLAIEMVNKIPAIAATRAAYKRCGKEPNRYRPSAEALTRRMVKGLELYRTLLAIDLINLISVVTGHSIGGFDADRIEGDNLTLGIGREGEEFHAIGRGELNIAGLPLYRDSKGGIGTPTSDCERTKLTPDTRRLLMLVNVYDTEADIDRLRAYILDTCARYDIDVTSSELIFRD